MRKQMIVTKMLSAKTQWDHLSAFVKWVTLEMAKRVKVRKTKGRQTDRKTGRQQRNWQTDRQVDKQAGRQTDWRTDRQIDIKKRRTNWETDKQAGGKTDRQKDRQAERQTNRDLHVFILTQILMNVQIHRYITATSIVLESRVLTHLDHTSALAKRDTPAMVSRVTVCRCQGTIVLFYI